MDVLNNPAKTKNEAVSNMIVVDDGSVRQPILNKYGDEIGVFYFRPTDVGIMQRYEEMIKGFDKITEPLSGININHDGTVNPENDAEVAAITEATKRLYEAVDRLFNGNMSEAFFGKMNPFSPVGGVFYCEHALNAVGKFIEGKFAEEGRHLSSRMQKYTRDYMPKSGAHKNGGHRRKKRGGK